MKKSAVGFADRDLSGAQNEHGDKSAATAKKIAAEFGVGLKNVVKMTTFPSVPLRG